MDKLVCVNDFEKLAKTKLSNTVWDYISGGATDEQTLEDNCSAFRRYRLRPQVLNDVSVVDMSTDVLGCPLSIPICVSATAFQKLLHPLGEVATAKGAASMGTGFLLSLEATSSIEEVADATTNSMKWLQMLVFTDRDFTKTFIERAERNGYRGIILTVDAPVLGKRYCKPISLPSPLRYANLDSLKNAAVAVGQDVGDYGVYLRDKSLQWSDIAWLKSITKLPIVLKGILTAEMAEIAVQHKVDGITVSNHGGRQLDGVPASIDALSEVVKAVNGRCEVYFDGGIRCGNDVFKAIALGARAVFIGRPALWGLACNGEAGVAEVLNMLKNELKTSMQLMGCRSLEEIRNNPRLVVPQSFYNCK